MLMHVMSAVDKYLDFTEIPLNLISRWFSSDERRHLGEYGSASSDVAYGQTKFHRYQCPLCGILTNKSNLPKHMRIHTGERPFFCKICNKDFTRTDPIYRHIRTIHKIENPAEYVGKK